LDANLLRERRRARVSTVHVLRWSVMLIYPPQIQTPITRPVCASTHESLPSFPVLRYRNRGCNLPRLFPSTRRQRGRISIPDSNCIAGTIDSYQLSSYIPQTRCERTCSCSITLPLCFARARTRAISKPEQRGRETSCGDTRD
jgi:hypothetical protein